MKNTTCACNSNCNGLSFCTTRFNCFNQKYLEQNESIIIYGCIDKCDSNSEIKCCKDFDFCNLNLNTIENKLFHQDTMIVTFTLACIILFLFILISLFITIKKIKKMRHEHKFKNELKKFRKQMQIEVNLVSSSVTKIESTTTGVGQDELVQRTISKDIHIDYDNGLIGKGRFGTVWKAKWNGDDIAVKVFFSMHELSWSRESEIFQTNLFHHENLLRYITSDIMGLGCTVNMIILTEYHSLGSLFDYLQTNTLNMKILIKFLYSISSGLNHLHLEIFSTNYKPCVIHRDLKTKNILVKSNLECCIADFGLAVKFDSQANKIYGLEDFSMQQGSIRYMSPECLNETLNFRSKECLKKSDIYSFSLVIWECLSRLKINNIEPGEHQPPFYEYVSGDPDIEIMKNLICSQMIRPNITFLEIFSDQYLEKVINVMKECWSNNPAERLSALDELWDKFCMSKPNLDELKKLPKIELHAHLSGSVRYETIIDLLNQQLESCDSLNEEKLKSEIDLLNCLKNKSSISCTNSRSLSECFQVFTILHRLLNNLEILEKVTEDILKDFESDNCVYLELRTTPRNIYDKNCGKIVVSKRDYLSQVIKVIENFEKNHKMKVRLILSVDRAKGLQDGLENVLLANELKCNYIVGIDFSGNPHENSFQEYEEIFELCKENGLRTTVHIAEIWEDKDKDFIFKKIRPDRIGHSVCLTQEEIEYLIENPIPIEICPTSNLVTKCVHRIDKHPFFYFYSKNKNYPLAICTDDSGIFDITLSKEYQLISDAFGLSYEQMFNISKKSLNSIFDESIETANFLNDIFKDFEQKYFEK